MNRPDYRIRGQKKTEDDYDQQIQQQLKLSRHLQNQKRQNGVAISRKHYESSQNSKLAESRIGSGSSNMMNSKVGRVLRMSKIDKNVVADIEFNNVRWISIVSAYDAKRLRHVTVSKQSCEAYMKRYGASGIKKDPAALAYFKDIKRHFHSWLGKINQNFTQVLDQFLKVNDKSPMQSLHEVEPTLSEISSDTSMMRQKLLGCLNIYQNNDFRKLQKKFLTFFQFSKGLEQLICVIYQSKEQINDLFIQLEDNEQNVDKKVEKIKRDGMKTAKNLIYNESQYNPNLCDRIINKVGIAINQMASKSLNVFHKLQGAKDLLMRLKRLLNDSHKKGLSMPEIRTMSKIFKEIIQQANKFQSFANNFNTDAEFVSEELRQKINIYRQNLEEKKKAVSQIQVIFVSTVINETIQTLRYNFIMNNSLSQQKIQFSQHNHLLEQISDSMLDQTRRAAVQSLIKHGKTNYTRLQQELDKIKRALRRNEDGISIDTEDGKISVLQYCKFTEQYKIKIKNLIKRHQESLKNLDCPYKEVRLPTSDKDPQLNFLNYLNTIVEVVNGRERRLQLQNEKGFQQLKGNISISGSEAQQAFSLAEQLEGNRQQIKDINQTNPLKNLIKTIKVQNCLYLQCPYILQSQQLCENTNQKNLIQNLTKLTQINQKRKKQLEIVPKYIVTKSYQHLVDRIYCLFISKGLKKKAIGELDNHKSISFPETQFEAKQMENQIKYRNLVGETIGQGGIFVKNRIKTCLKVMKDMILSYRIIEKLKQNQNGKYIILVETLGGYVAQFFKICISPEDLAEKVIQTRKICIQALKCLKNKMANIQLLDQEIDIDTAQAGLKVRNQILKTQSINEKAIKVLQQLSKNPNNTLEVFSKFIHTISEYIQQSKQIAYIALNQFKQPIWIGPSHQAKQGIFTQIGIKGYKRGTFIDIYQREPPKVRNEVVIEKVSPTKKVSSIIVKQKSHEKQAMDEEIAVEQSQQEIKEDQIDDINDQMNEQIDEIGDFVQENDEMIDQIEEDGQVSDDKMDEEIQQVELPKAKINKQPQTKQVQKQKVNISAKESTYQIIPHFRQLQQIRSLFLKINTTQLHFWSTKVDFQEIEDFYQRPQDLKDRINFIKSIQMSFGLYLDEVFTPKIAEDIKKLQKFILFKNTFNNLGEKSWNILFKILSIIDFSYSLLLTKSPKEQILQIYIASQQKNDFKKEGGKKVLSNYLVNNFKSIYFNIETFQLDQYFNSCFKNQTQEILNSDGGGFHYITKITVKSLNSLPTPQTHSQLAEIEMLSKKFLQKMITGINLGSLCIQLWLKGISSMGEDYYKPDFSILDSYISKISTIQKSEWIGYFIKTFRIQSLSARDKIKAHKNLIDNTLFKVENSNIWQCIKQVSQPYELNFNKSVYIEKKGGVRHLAFAQISQQPSANLTQSNITTFLSKLLAKKEDTTKEVVIKIDSIIELIALELRNHQIDHTFLNSLSQLLNIFQVQHYYIKQPQFILKNNKDDLILTLIKHMKVQKKEDLQYQSIFNDLFNHKRVNFTNQISFKDNVNFDILAQANIDKFNKQMNKIEQEQKEHAQKFINVIQNNQIYTVLLDKITNKTDNAIINGVKEYNLWCESTQQEIKSKISDKTKNPLFYIHQKRKKIKEIQSSINQSQKDISNLTHVPKNQDIHSIIDWGNQFMTNLSKWTIERSLAKHLTTYIVNDGQRNWIIGLQLTVGNAKEFLFTILHKYWIDPTHKKQWKLIFQFIFNNYIQSNIQSTINNNQTSIVYNLKAVIKVLISEIRKDLVKVDDLVAFTRLYNQHRFGTNPSILNKLQQYHTNITTSLKLKIELIQIKQYTLKTSWIGIDKLSILIQLLESMKNELPYQQDNLQKLLKQTEFIGIRETDLNDFLQWYIACAVKQMKIHYYLVKSSKGETITLLPITKIEKDKSKSAEEIRKMLEEIKLQAKYSIKLEQGVSNIHLQPQLFTCILQDSEKYLCEQAQLQNFQPEVAEGQMLLTCFYQHTLGKQPIFLSINQLKLTTQCCLEISQEYTSATITCGIWKILKQDFQQFKRQYSLQNHSDLKILKKKIRGSASPQQKIKDVCIGQTINFTQIGAWLREEVKKHLKRVQQKQKAQQQRKRLHQLLIKQSEHFLKTIYEQMISKEGLPTVKLSLKQIQAYSSQDTKPQGKAIILTGYWKKILDSNKKIIEKLEESKSRENVSKLADLTKDYLKILANKLEQTCRIEKDMISDAQKDYLVIKTKIEQENAEKKRLKDEAKQEKRKLKQEKRALLKARLQEEEKLQKLNANTAEQTPNSLNITPNIVVKNETTLNEKKPNVAEIQQKSSQQAQNKEQQPLFDPTDMILQCKQLASIKKGQQQQSYMGYLIYLLEDQTQKDYNLYKCILQHFWKLSTQKRQSLVLLK